MQSRGTVSTCSWGATPRWRIFYFIYFYYFIIIYYLISFLMGRGEGGKAFFTLKLEKNIRRPVTKIVKIVKFTIIFILSPSSLVVVLLNLPLLTSLKPFNVSCFCILWICIPIYFTFPNSRMGANVQYLWDVELWLSKGGDQHFLFLNKLWFFCCCWNFVLVVLLNQQDCCQPLSTEEFGLYFSRLCSTSIPIIIHHRWRPHFLQNDIKL